MNIKRIFYLITFLGLCASCKETNEQRLDKRNKLSKEKNYDKAIEVYNTVIKNNSKLQLAYYNRGITYLGLKKYNKALWDFNKVMALQTHGDFIIIDNQDSPFANEEARTQVPYNDALYQRAQVKYFMDSLKSSFMDFQILVDNNYEEKSNCVLWQGALFIRGGKTAKACEYFEKAKQLAVTANDRDEASNMLKTHCKELNNNR